MLEGPLRQTQHPSGLTTKTIDRVITFQTPTMLTAETATTHSMLNSSGPSSFRSNWSAFTGASGSNQTRMQMWDGEAWLMATSKFNDAGFELRGENIQLFHDTEERKWRCLPTSVFC